MPTYLQRYSNPFCNAHKYAPNEQERLLLATFTLAFGFFAQNTFGQASGIKPELIMYRHKRSAGLSPGVTTFTNNLHQIKTE